MIILVMGLSGSGKTTLAVKLRNYFGCVHINADKVRESANDWDFSEEGRVRQAHRIKELAGRYEDMVICDFICPTQHTRRILQSDFTIFMDTTSSSKYLDTDSIFETPTKYDIKISDTTYKVQDIATKIIKKGSRI